MGRVLDEITPELETFLAAQHVFFVATAPTDGGHVNLSPKGLDTFAVLEPRRVAYLDLTGSGAETIAHLRENGRMTIMFCAFEGNPSIVRIYGTGNVVPVEDASDELLRSFPDLPGARSVITVDVERVSTSCGYAVPLMIFAGSRSRLLDWAEKKGPDGLAEYRATKNVASIDGLPALLTQGE